MFCTLSYHFIHSENKITELKKYIEEGDYSWRILGGLAGLITVAFALMNFISNFFSLDALHAIINIYLFFGGLISVILENKNKTFTAKYLAILRREALFLYKPYGRAGFYFLLGTMLACAGGWLSFLAGVCVAVVGVVIFYAARNAEKALAKLKEATHTTKEVSRMFDEYDKNKNGSLDTHEIGLLCASLGKGIN
jgi:hypothetical protein